MDIFSAKTLETWQIIVFVCGFIMMLLIIVLFVIMFKMKAKADLKKVEGIKIVNNVRYTKSEEIVNDDGSLKVSHIQGDIVLERGKVYTASKTGKLLPGKYVVLSANENIVAFNIRLNGFVREVTHNTPIVIADGEEICATSHNVILR